MSVLDSIAPVKEIRLKQRTEAWMTSEILELILELITRYLKKNTNLIHTIKTIASIEIKSNIWSEQQSQIIWQTR